MSRTDRTDAGKTSAGWTPAQDAALLKAMQDGMSFGGAALLLAELPGDAGRAKVSRNACISRYARLTGRARKRGADHCEENLDMVEAGSEAGAAAKSRARRRPATPGGKAGAPAAARRVPGHAGLPRRTSPAPQPQPEPEAPGISFLATGPFDCRWPLAGEGLAMRVCGAGAVPCRPYCADHMQLAYVPVPVRPGRPAGGERARAGMAAGGVA